MSSYITIDGWHSNIRFSSAHIIHEYEKCGRLHGHTYAVHVKIYGKPDSKGIILDFSLLKNVLRDIVNELDHRVLIPEKCNKTKLEKTNTSVKINAMEKKYVFPLSDCMFLPIKSTSAENLAEYILGQFMKKIDLPKQVECVEIGVDEGYGQGARLAEKL